MKRIFILAFTCIIFLAVSLGFTAQIGESMGSNNYIVFRANVSPLYIRNVSAPVQILAIPFQDNKPIYANLELYVNIKGLNIDYNYTQTISIISGKSQTIYLPAMREGHYFITLYAEYHGIKSIAVKEDFGVVPAPLPYTLYFDNDGSSIHFKSKVLNATGHIDPNTTFTLQVYLWDGNQQSLVAVYQKVTNLTIEVQPSWKTGILTVDVIDKYGWVNGMSIDLSNFQFQGTPVQYDYEQKERYPLAGRDWQWYVTVIFAVLILLAIGKRVLGDGGEE